MKVGDCPALGRYQHHPEELSFELNAKTKGSDIHQSDVNKKIEWSDLTDIEKLADGVYTCIHAATWKGKSVVVKSLRRDCELIESAVDEIILEYDINSKLMHPNIARFYGGEFIFDGIPFLVMERLEGGTLSHALGYKGNSQKHKKKFNYMEVLTYSIDLADALNYLHTKAIPESICIHRDLKPDNIGFTKDGRIKLFDFGLACIIDAASTSYDKTYQMSGETGSPRYMAPEVAQSKPYNQKVDVYSYGVILWEMMSKKKPFKKFGMEKYQELVVKQGERPKIPTTWPTSFSDLIKECWSADIQERPNFSEIYSRLYSLRLELIFCDEKSRCERRSGLHGIMKVMKRRASMHF